MKRIFCLGDSNTYGYDPRSYLGGRYPETVRWTGLLRERNWEILNFGQNGMEIPTRQWEFDHWGQRIAQSAPLHLVTVMLGGNDLLQHRTFQAEHIAERMERFLSYLTATDFPCGFLLISPPPMCPGQWVDEPRLLEQSARLDRHYREVARTLGIASVDAGAWDVETAFDGVHFSPAGHAAFASGLDGALRELLGTPDG